MDRDNLAPLWEVLHALVPPQPQTPVQAGAVELSRDPARTSWKPGSAITAREAVRRVLILENPGMRGQSSHHAQPVLRAAAHPAGRNRARATAIRSRRCASSSKATGAYTAVDGERTTMHPGRFHHHAVVDLARPRQSRHASPWSGWTASTSASSQPFDAQFARELPRRKSSRCTAREGDLGGPLRQQPRAARRRGCPSARPRRSSATRTSAAARRSPRCAQNEATRMPATAGRCSSSTR